MVSDNILQAQLVVANGTLVTASAARNRDLYFALRGAGAASYGIVTQFTFRMNDVSAPVTHFKYTWTNRPAVQVQNFKAFQAWGVHVPAEISATFYMDPFGKSWLEGTYLGPRPSLPPLIQTFLLAAGANPTVSVEELTWIQVILVNAGYPSSTNPITLRNPPLPSITFKAVRPHTTGDAYQNYIDRDIALSAYYGSNLDVLIAGKQKWDSKNAFNFPQSIPLQ